MEPRGGAAHSEGEGWRMWLKKKCKVIIEREDSEGIKGEQVIFDHVVKLLRTDTPVATNEEAVAGNNTTIAGRVLLRLDEIPTDNSIAFSRPKDSYSV